MDVTKTKAFVDQNFEDVFVKVLSGFVEIPNLTPGFDESYFTNGLVEQAVEYVTNFADSLKIPGLKHYVHKEKGRPPMVCIVYPGEVKTNVMVYGHLDKQPHMTAGWSEGLGPCKPVIRGNKLYGRGSADDGYAPMAFLLAIQAAREQGKKLPRLVLTLECEEESGSENLLYLLDKMNEHVGVPDFCICLDSETCDYSRIWMTTSLKGMVSANVKCSALKGGLHSGLFGGIAPETFGILRQILDRFEDPETGKVNDLLDTPIPDSKREEARKISDYLGDELYAAANLLPGVKAVSQHDLADMYLNNTWKATLAITGAAGLPHVGQAGNVLRPWTELRISVRLPPNKSAEEAKKAYVELCTKDVPNNAVVEVNNLIGGTGFMAKPLHPWVYTMLDAASNSFFGQDHGTYGIGGSIPFLCELANKFPSTQIIALGAMGPDCNAHNPDESLDLVFARKFIGALSHMFADIADNA